MKRVCSYLLLLILCMSCSREVKYLSTSLTIHETLPIYFEKLDCDTLLLQDDLTYHFDVLLLNSQEDVQTYVEKHFLDVYPEYLQVDFSKYSLIVWTDFVFYEIINRDIAIYRNNSDDFYSFYVNYDVGELCDNDPYIERIAIVTDKIESGTKIERRYSISRVTP